MNRTRVILIGTAIIAIIALCTVMVMTSGAAMGLLFFTSNEQSQVVHPKRERIAPPTASSADEVAVQPTANAAPSADSEAVSATEASTADHSPVATATPVSNNGESAEKTTSPTETITANQAAIATEKPTTVNPTATPNQTNSTTNPTATLLAETAVNTASVTITPTPTATSGDDFEALGNETEGEVTATATATPAPSTTTEVQAVVGRVLLNGTATKGITVQLEDETFKIMGQTTTDGEGKYRFEVPDGRYNMLFMQEANSQYKTTEVVSWGSLGSVTLTEGLITLPDFEVGLQGFTQQKPSPNSTYETDDISSQNPLQFTWSAYPKANSYWVDLSYGDQMELQWQSPMVNGTSVSFDGQLDNGRQLSPGNYWWGVGIQQMVDGYVVTRYGYLPALKVVDPR